MDIALSSVLLLIFSPIIIVLSLIIKVKMGSPIFFKQQRPGLRGRPFVMYKLRTMSNQRDPDGELLPDSERFTNLGRFIRSTSLDELPELYNVLKGEMSLVGPRPLLLDYLEHYTPEQARRHEVKPGITGWAQINGRNTLSWEEKFKLDVWYVNNCSFKLDMRILFLTIWKVLRRQGISHSGEVTMPEFTGTKAS